MPDRPDPLFRPFRLGGLEVAGRIVKSATSETSADENGRVADAALSFYEPIARGGAPLIVTGNIYVSADGRSTPGQMGAAEDGCIPGLRRLAAAVHAHGSLIFAQLSHCGRQVLPRAVGLEEAVSASDVRDLTLGTKPRPLREEEIARIVAEFAEAASRCVRAGFDGIQIHAGHGYLLSQFLTPRTNRRTDGYGGSLENRARLLREVHRAIRARVDVPVIVKINGADRLPLGAGLGTAELVEVARLLEHDGIDGVEVSVGHYESGFPVVRGTFRRCLRGMAAGSARHLPQPWRAGFRLGWPLLALFSDLVWPRSEGFNLRYARRFKAALSIPVICVGGFRGREAMVRAIEEDACDAVSCARAFVADPYLVRHLRARAEGPRCVFCNACVGRIGAEPLDCLHPEVRRAKDAMLASG